MQAGTRHLDDVALRVAGRRLQKRSGLAAELEDLHLVVDQDARRGVAGQQHAVEVLGDVHPAANQRPRVGLRERAFHPPWVEPGGESQRARKRGTREDLVRLVGDREQLGEPGDALGVAEQQIAGLVQRVVKAGNDPLLQRLIEVDEDVATAHQIQLRERRIAGEVVLHEHAQIPDRLVDAIATVGLDEVAPAPLLAHIAQRSVAVKPGARLGDDRLAQVGAEDLNGAGGAFQELEQRDRDRVHLFAGGAAGHPDANRAPHPACPSGWRAGSARSGRRTPPDPGRTR